MRFYLISDNVDTQIGLRLSGIEGEVVHTAEETETALERAFAMPDVAVVMITVKLSTLCRARVDALRLRCPQPLIVEIPDRHGGRGREDILRYVREAIGLKA